MKNRLKVLFSIALALVGAPVVLLAHHGSAIYDNTKTLVLQGTVTEWSWTNPHCLLEFDVTDDKGTAVHWVAEVSNPTDMINLGWSKNMFKPGDKVTVTTTPAKNGQPIGAIKAVEINGKTFKGVGFGPRPGFGDSAGKP